MNIEISELELFSFSEPEADIIAEAFEKIEYASPFSDNGGISDGPSYLIPAETIWDFPELLLPENFLSLKKPLVGYEISPYNKDFISVIKEIPINRWMGIQSSSLLYIVCSPEKAELLIDKLERGV